jgi:hypothetical protein
MSSKGTKVPDLPTVVRLEGLAFEADDSDPICTQDLGAQDSLASCSVLDDDECGDEPETCEIADRGNVFPFCVSEP